MVLHNLVGELAWVVIDAHEETAGFKAVFEVPAVIANVIILAEEPLALVRVGDRGVLDRRFATDRISGGIPVS